MIYNIKEIFLTLQGEGFNTGRKAVFCRFSGCNLWNGLEKSRKKAKCSFCDTDFVGTNGKNGGRYELKYLVDKIIKIWDSSLTCEKKFIVLTGGEPLLQVDWKLLKELKKNNFFISLETNGTILTKLNFDWVTVSPKEKSDWKLRKGNELKLVYPQYGFDLKKIQKLDFEYFFLQPKDKETNRLNIIKTINYCKSHKPWFPSFQIHKSLGIS